MLTFKSDPSQLNQVSICFTSTERNVERFYKRVLIAKQVFFSHNNLMKIDRQGMVSRLNEIHRQMV